MSDGHKLKLLNVKMWTKPKFTRSGGELEMNCKITCSGREQDDFSQTKAPTFRKCMRR